MFLLPTLLVIVISSCAVIENTYKEDQYQRDVSYSSEPTWSGINGMNDVMHVDGYKDIDLDDIINNPEFSVHENDKIQRIIVNILLYTHGFDIDFNDISILINEKASREWFEVMMGDWVNQDADREGWGVIDEINRIRDFNDDRRTLNSFLADFMMGRSTYVSGNRLNVTVPFWQLCLLSEQTSGYMLYRFVFEKNNGIYKLIGLTVDA